jgi:hypothetical protein
MTKYAGLLKRWIAAAPLSLLLAAHPLTVQVAGAPPSVDVKLSSAAAKDGGDDGGDSSGPGGGGGGDDHGGHGGGGDDHSGHGGDDDREDDRDDDRSGSRSGPHGEKLERRGGKIQVVYPDGYREELDGGWFEMRDPRGRTVIERRATPADRVRLEALFR